MNNGKQPYIVTTLDFAPANQDRINNAAKTLNDYAQQGYEIDSVLKEDKFGITWVLLVQREFKYSKLCDMIKPLVATLEPTNNEGDSQ